MINRHFDPTKPHHTPVGFRNNYVVSVEKSLRDLLRWQWQRVRTGARRISGEAAAAIEPNLDFLTRNATAAGMQAAVTWIGHSSMLIQAGGLNILTDPVFSNRASPLQFVGPKRAQPPGLALAAIPAVDVVVISHNHYDHLDRGSVLEIRRRFPHAQFLVPLGVADWMQRVGVEPVVELDWWQSHRIGEVNFYFTPTQHWSSRSLNDRSHTLWGAWAGLSADCHWYFGGDSGFSRDFADTRRFFEPQQQDACGGPFDLALLAIGAYQPRWFMREQHVDPAEALLIHQTLGAKRSIGMHWGTFRLTDEPFDQPPKDLQAAIDLRADLQPAFSVLPIGATVQIERRRPADTPTDR